MNLEDGLAFLELTGEICEKPQVKEELVEWMQLAKHELAQGIENQTSPDGTPYTPLAPSTVRRKGHDTALFETGELLRSVASTGSGHIEEATGNTATLGTGHEKNGKPIALYMQEGTKNKSGGVHIPARPFIGVTEQMADEAAELIADGIMARIDSL